MPNTNTSDSILSGTLQDECRAAGRRFRRASRARALEWFDSQQNTIGFPYMDPTTYAAALREFLRAAGKPTSASNAELVARRTK